MNKFDIAFIKNTIKKTKDCYSLTTVKGWMKKETDSLYEIEEAINNLKDRNIFEIIVKSNNHIIIQINRNNYIKFAKEYSYQPSISSGRELQMSFEDSIRKSLQK